MFKGSTDIWCATPLLLLPLASTGKCLGQPGEAGTRVVVTHSSRDASPFGQSCGTSPASSAKCGRDSIATRAYSTLPSTPTALTASRLLAHPPPVPAEGIVLALPAQPMDDGRAVRGLHLPVGGRERAGSTAGCGRGVSEKRTLAKSCQERQGVWGQSQGALGTLTRP